MHGSMGPCGVGFVIGGNVVDELSSKREIIERFLQIKQAKVSTIYLEIYIHQKNGNHMNLEKHGQR
jgi:hypothetical protein